jgi:predicted dehydrogenase
LEKQIGFGIIGTGNIAKLHARCIEAMPNAKLLGIVSKTKSRAEAVQESFSSPLLWEMDQLLNISGLEIVCVCNESGLHLETISKIAKYGINILCEKPLEITTDRIDAISNIIKEYNVKLGCIFQNRMNPEFIQLKKILADGLLGKILLVQTSINWYRSSEYYEDSWRGTKKIDGGATFINQGIHTIDLMINLIGEVQEISGFIDTLHHNIEGEDVGVASFRFKSGVLGTLSGGTSLYPGEPESIGIFGTLGNIQFKGGQIVSSSISKINDLLNIKEDSNGSVASDPMAIGDQFHIDSIRNMIEAVKDGKEPLVGVNEARKSVAFINALYRSKGNVENII